MRRLVIIGAGGYGQTVADVAWQLHLYDEIVFLDDNSSDKRVIGKCEDYIDEAFPGNDIYPAFGNNALRIAWIDRLITAEVNVPTIVHSSAYISPMASLECGTVVLPNAIVNTNVTIGRGCIINCGAIIDHGCIIEEGSHVCLGAIIKAENRIPKCMKIEAGEVIQNRKYPLNGEK